MSTSRPRVSIIVGSTRPVRIGRQLADSIVSAAGEQLAAELNVLDLRDIGLPLLDEPLMPGLHRYAHAHTLAWADAIEASDAVVFLTPQYNGGYPAALKNAIDYLYAEWRGRPAAIISYGGHGGDLAARQLREVLDRLRMDVVDEQPRLRIAQTDYTPEWRLGDPDAVVNRHAEEIGATLRALTARIKETTAA